MEKTQIHRPTSQEAVRPGVVERQDGLRTKFLHDRREAGIDEIEGLLPRDRRKAPFALVPNTL